MTNKTFFDLVDDIIETLQLANDRIGALRDAAENEDQKKVFNQSRELLQTKLLPEWRRYRNNLPGTVGSKDLGKGWTGRCKYPSNDD